MKHKKTIAFFCFGALFYLLDCLIYPEGYVPSSDGRGYSLGGMLALILISPPMGALVILGLPCLIVGKVNKSYRKPILVFSILFFAAALFRFASTAFQIFFVAPEMESLIKSGKLSPETVRAIQQSLPSP